MGKTVNELKSSLSQAELIDWMAYDRLDPIGGYRQDLQTAMLALVQSGSATATLNDFILIDPNPVTEEEAERLERERQAEQAKLAQQRVVAMLDSIAVEEV